MSEYEKPKSRSTGRGSSIGGAIWLEVNVFEHTSYSKEEEVVIFTVRDRGAGGDVLARRIATAQIADDLESFARSLRNVLDDAARAALSKATTTEE